MGADMSVGLIFFLPLPVETLLHESCLIKDELLLLTHGIRNICKDNKANRRIQALRHLLYCPKQNPCQKKGKIAPSKSERKTRGKMFFFLCFINGTTGVRPWHALIGGYRAARKKVTVTPVFAPHHVGLTLTATQLTFRRSSKMSLVSAISAPGAK
jgi:hypothetical protein